MGRGAIYRPLTFDLSLTTMIREMLIISSVPSCLRLSCSPNTTLNIPGSGLQKHDSKHPQVRSTETRL